MLAILLLCQPAPSVALRPEPAFPQVVAVDVIIVNQYCRRSRDHTGKLKSTVVFYVSFWSIHNLPPFSSCQIPVWEYRGWCRNRPLLPCDGGWGCQVNDITIIAPKVLFVVSDYDFEYRNRRFGWGRLVN